MKLFRTFHENMRRSTWLVVISLLLLTIAVIVACGKLTNESQQPTTPVGPSDGVSIPVGDQRCWGTYCLSLSASPNSIPADGVTYTGLKATLTDTSGRSLENFLITFSASTSSDGIAFFTPYKAGIGGLEGDTITVSDIITGLTHSGGTVSVSMYGAQSGSVVVQAKVDIDQNAVNDLFTTTVVMLTPSSGLTSTAGSYRLSLTADPMTIVGDGINFSTLTAHVTDSSGGPVNGLIATFTVMNGIGSVSPTSTFTDNQGLAYSQFTGRPPIGGSALIMVRVAIPDLIGYLTAMIRVSVIQVGYTPTPQPTAMPTATARPTVTPTAAPTPIPVSITFLPLHPATTTLDQLTFIMYVRANNLPLSGVVMNLATDPPSAAFPDGSAVQRITNSDGQISDTISFAGSGEVDLNVMVNPGQGYSGTGLLTITFLP